MLSSLRQLDRLLHGEATSPDSLAGDRFDFPVLGLSAVLVVLGMIYGACMGLFAVLGSGSGHGMQVLASSVKLPLLFLLTLVVTFPSLYVFNSLFGARLRLPRVLRLMIGSLAITLAVLSSLGPIVAFFSVSSTSYAFILLLNVLVFAIAGFLGLGFLLQTLHRMAGQLVVETPTEGAGAESVSPPQPLSPIARADDRPLNPVTKTIFRIWVIVFGLVGAQMAWVLRPFIGSPGKAFEWFRERDGGNFFEAVLFQLGRLLGIG